MSDCHLDASTTEYFASSLSFALRFRYSLGVSGFDIVCVIISNAL